MTKQLPFEPSFPDCVNGFSRILSSRLCRCKPRREFCEHDSPQPLKGSSESHLSTQESRAPIYGNPCSRDLIFCGEWVCTNEHHGKEARNGYPAYGLYQRRPLEGGGVNSAEFGAMP